MRKPFFKKKKKTQKCQKLNKITLYKLNKITYFSCKADVSYHTANSYTHKTLARQSECFLFNYYIDIRIVMHKLFFSV